ncbi:MAG: hypothetical protein NZ903_00905, partial [Candidatus Micrarchaeota archaeon]|nr:hypothetical protein [Candidatus Micrarchaeota archaeon]
DRDVLTREIKRGISSIAKRKGITLNSFDIQINSEVDFKEKLYPFESSSGAKVAIKAYSATSPNATISFEGDPYAKLIALYFGIGDRTKLGFGMLGIKKAV